MLAFYKIKLQNCKQIVYLKIHILIQKFTKCKQKMSL